MLKNHEGGLKMGDLTKSATEPVYEQAVKDLEEAPIPNATEKVRQLLDEIGIEWSSPELSPNQTRFPNVKFEPWGVGTLKVTLFNLTPEQAIVATLGSSNDIAKALIDDMLDFIGNCCETTLDCGCCDPVDCKYLDGDGEIAECTRYQDFLSRAKAIAATQGGGKCESCSTRYQQLFGTPEKAAQTITDACGESEYCGGCPALEMYCNNGDYNTLLEWLRSDAE